MGICLELISIQLNLSLRKKFQGTKRVRLEERPNTQVCTWWPDAKPQSGGKYKTRPHKGLPESIHVFKISAKLRFLFLVVDFSLGHMCIRTDF